ncbi:MAG TPA: Gfo/Idh/MocA family oxidoreductase, partial [Vicinamibacteria bacterium]
MTGKPRAALSRRDVLKSAALVGLGARALTAPSPAGATPAPPQGPLPAAESVASMRFDPRSVVRLGLVGCGGRGQSLLRDLLGVDKTAVKALCDVVEERVAESLVLVGKRGQAPPATYTEGDHAFEKLCARDDLDVVVIATPWRWHVEMAVSAMTAGKHAFVEVPAATTLEDCWTLVDASERTRRHCVMLENCCYGYNELMVLNMARAGFFGELTHAEAAYIHDLRKLLFEDEGEGLWRRAEHVGRDGNLYPTHGLGPVASYLDVNRGDRFERLVSMSSTERSLSAYREANVPAGSPKRSEAYTCGDMNTTLIKTALGRTVLLQHDVVTPRPYSRINHLSGTKGAFRDYPPRLFQDGQAEHQWGP